jgi:NADPH:quinone reductase
MRKRGRIHASTLRSRSIEEKEDVIRRLEGHALPLLADNRLTVPVEETFPLERAQAAYERFAAGGKFGKLVIVP